MAFAALRFPQLSVRHRRCLGVGLFLCAFLGAFLCVFGWAPPAIADDAKTDVSVTSWLTSAVTPAPLPAFSVPPAAGKESEAAPAEESAAADDSSDDSSAVDFGSLLAVPSLDPKVVWPVKGAAPEAAAESPWTVGPPSPPRQGAARAWFATYVEADRFVASTLSITSRHPFVAYWGGEQIAERKSSEPADKNSDGSGEESSAEAGPKPVTAEVSLVQGKHLLLVESLYDPAVGGAWTVDAAFAVATEREASVSTSVDAQRVLRLADLLDGDAILGVGLSADGQWISVRLRDSQAPRPEATSRTEIRAAADGRVVRTLHGSESEIQWAPTGDRFAYTASSKGRDGEGTDLWVASVTGESRRVLTQVEDFGSFDWLPPSGDALVFSTSETPEADSRGVKLLRGPNDRWPQFRSVSSLYRLDLDSGAWQRLTAGDESVTYHDARPDGGALLVSISRYQDDDYPFNNQDLYELDLGTLEPRYLNRGVWFNDAVYAPDGSYAVATGSPIAFGPEGSTLAEDELVNLYDSQLYRLDLADGSATAVSRELDSAVENLVGWSGAGELLLRAQTGPRVQLLVWRPTVGANGAFTTLDWSHGEVRLDNVGSAAVAAAGDRVVINGEGAATSPRVLTARLDSGRLTTAPRNVVVPLAAHAEQLRLGKVEDWTFTTEAGDELDGHITYPPDFDPSQKYPLLVYYYAGTVPSSIGFGGRYPKDLWAALGYVVVVMQPSGATGYGQEFSARHLNNWGSTVAGEIIEGTESFVEQHDFIDADRIGCLGASYGGFMTMHLLTQTDIFSAAVAHAGISSISSYWGEGYWGWLYSAVASAESYPWNNPELYVEQSPLFSADKIQTPLLLTHGDADTNVPVGESEQLYVALRILGREVEFLEIEGQDHRIVPYDKKKLWTQAIIAWFDRYLRDQPEYWEHLFGTADEPKG